MGSTAGVAAIPADGGRVFGTITVSGRYNEHPWRLTHPQEESWIAQSFRENFPVSPGSGQDGQPVHDGPDVRTGKMSVTETLDRFLAGIERKAFHFARLAVGDVDDALDIVQDSMMVLAQKYGGKDPESWRPLFYRILRNRITDHQRRGRLRQRIMGFLGTVENEDPVQQFPDSDSAGPDWQNQLRSTSEKMIQAVESLPARQREVFLLRAWEGMDVKETARAMKCSAGSVKTHYSRAVHALREILEEYHEH